MAQISTQQIHDLYKDPEQCAKHLRLQYIQDFSNGYRQEKHGRGLRFFDSNNQPVKDRKEIKSLTELRIPPAWQDVWICPNDNGHIVAIGTDEEGRKQYRYHQRWTTFRRLLNSYRLIPFGSALSAIRTQTAQINANTPITAETTLLAAIRLLDDTWIRIGMPNEDGEAVGLLTLEEEHVEVGRDAVTLEFTGKSHKDHEIEVDDKPLTKFIAALVDTGDDEIFSFTNSDGDVEVICAEDLNNALKELSGEDISAKDFRTWGGTLTAFQFLIKHPERNKKARETVVKNAIVEASEELGNTPAVARAHYVHPHVVEEYRKGRLIKEVENIQLAKPIPHLTKDEQRLMLYLEQLLARQAVIA